jgi:hypothetical protein
VDRIIRAHYVATVGAFVSRLHLHEYIVGRLHYGIPGGDWPSPEPVIDERRVRLNTLIDSGNQRSHSRRTPQRNAVDRRPLDPAAFDIDDVNERLSTTKA